MHTYTHTQLPLVNLFNDDSSPIFKYFSRTPIYVNTHKVIDEYKYYVNLPCTLQITSFSAANSCNAPESLIIL